MQHQIKRISLNYWFYLFLITHLCVWTLAPTMVRLNLPLDSIEGTIWGQEWQWGYDKNPFLNGWLTGLGMHLSANKDWIVYLFSQLSVALCLWSVWKLANEFLSKSHALFAVLLLECLQYFHLHAIDFNDNTLELGLWAVTIYCFYCAIFSTQTLQKYAAWIATGLFAALGLMAKYYTAALFAAMFLFLLSDKNLRKEFVSLPLWLSIATFFLIIFPHFYWLFHHDFITFQYVIMRADSEPAFSNHFFFPLQFIWQQFEVFIPALVLIAIFSFGKNAASPSEEKTVSNIKWRFLLFMAFGPLVLTALLSLLLGIKLRAGWGMPLLSLWGIVLIRCCRHRLNPARLSAFILTIFLLMSAFVFAYSVSLIKSKTPSSANFPGAFLAKTLTEEWKNEFGQPLKYVAGSRWVGGNISHYSSDHPHVFIEWSKPKAPWINLGDLNKQGALFVWEISGGEVLPPEIKQQFPRLRTTEIMKFHYLRDQNFKVKPVILGIAKLPPH